MEGPSRDSVVRLNGRGEGLAGPSRRFVVTTQAEQHPGEGDRERIPVAVVDPGMIGFPLQQLCRDVRGGGRQSVGRRDGQQDA